MRNVESLLEGSKPLKSINHRIEMREGKFARQNGNPKISKRKRTNAEIKNFTYAFSYPRIKPFREKNCRPTNVRLLTSKI